MKPVLRSLTPILTRRRRYFSFALATLLFALGLSSSQAGSATWKTNPSRDDWNDSANWTPATVPNGPADTATFAHTQQRQAAPTVNTEVNSIIFQGSDSSFTVLTQAGITLTISGTGVTNNSGLTRNFLSVTQSAVAFTNSATIVGAQTVFQNNGTPTVGQPGGFTTFSNTASAGAATFTNVGSLISGGTGGVTQFNDSATAAAANITNQGGLQSGEFGGVTEFRGFATAGAAAIVNQPGAVTNIPFAQSGLTNFYDNATAGSATLTNIAAPNALPYPGTTRFFGSSSADHAIFNNGGQVDLYDNATAADGNFTLTGGNVFFYGTSTAANARFTLFDDPTRSALFFQNSSSAGNAIITRAGSTQFSSILVFFDDATGDHLTMTANGTDIAGGQADACYFYDASTAGNATITLNGGTVTDSVGATAFFYDDASAAESSLTVNGAAATGEEAAAFLQFATHATAANATLIANGGTNGGAGGTIHFARDGQGGTARIELFGNARLELGADRHALSLTIGSLEGTGQVFLEKMQLIVGANNLSTTFSGSIQESDDPRVVGGSLSKLGRGTFTLSGASRYAGGTTVTAGTLLVSNTTGSATGSGAVQINKGTLGGGGIISGAVIVGTGSGAGASLYPGTGARKVVTLTLANALTFKSGSSGVFRASTKTAASDKVSANGVTIETGATFSLLGLGNRAIASGTVMTVISNTAATPIAGTFSNLADGATITVGINTYQASYEGGDGNDLTLTVL